MKYRPPSGTWGAAGSFGPSARIGCPPPSGVLVTQQALKLPVTQVARREDQSVIIAEQRAGGAASVSTKFIVVVPSARLRVKFGAVFVPDNPSVSFTFDVADVWQVAPMYYVEAMRDHYPGQNVFTASQPLPAAYEIDTAAERFQVSITLGGAADANHPLGTWHAIASWEPGSGVDMDDTERGGLFSRCAILPGGVVKVLGA